MSDQTECKSRPRFKHGDLVHHVVTICPSNDDATLDYDVIECGIVVLVQPCTEVCGGWDCFAACFPPGHKPGLFEQVAGEKPFILRYFDTSWQPGWPHLSRGLP